MPIYEYQAEIPEKGCEICREGFEYIQGIDESPFSDCPNCGKRVKRIISWCHAAIIDPSERAGQYSHAAELADKHSHKSKDKLLKERALENYKKAGYKFDSTINNDT
jgi:putative FmdB family regulatory protein